MLTGRFANVTIGYFPDGYRDELRDSVRACGPAGFLADEASRFDASRMPPGLDLEARVDWAIEQILSTHAQEAQALANAAHAAAAGRYPVAAVRMAGSMVAVEVDGTIHGLAA